jgi:hypothetical protein
MTHCHAHGRLQLARPEEADLLRQRAKLRMLVVQLLPQRSVLGRLRKPRRQMSQSSRRSHEVGAVGVQGGVPPGYKLILLAAPLREVRRNEADGRTKH